jgi:catalase
MISSEELDALAREALAQTDSDMGRYPGYRAAQAKGTLCRATFESTGNAAPLTRAAHLQPGAKVPVTVRFSNSATNPTRRDGAVDVRGMSVAFHLPGGGRTDLIGLFMPRFFVGTARQFVWWQHVMKRPALGGLPLPHLIRLGGYLLAGRLPPSFGWWQLKGLKRVPSYANCRYNSLHSYKLFNQAGEPCYVRYTWLPLAGEQTLWWWNTRRRHPDYLRHELAGRLSGGPIQFQLWLQRAKTGDPVHDAARPWPKDREWIDAGRLDVTALGVCDEMGVPPLRFDPTRMTDGIQLPELDTLLMLRKRVYELSFERRTADRDGAAQ